MPFRSAATLHSGVKWLLGQHIAPPKAPAAIVPRFCIAGFYRRASILRLILRRFRRDRRGAAALLTASALVAVIGAAALAVDTSMFYVTKRKLQSAVDLAALAAAADLPNASAAAQASLAANGFPASTVTVTSGIYTADPSRPVGSRFVANVTPANAVLVRATTSMPMMFGMIFVMTGVARGTPSGGVNGSVAIGASASAALTPAAAFAIGSRLATFNGGIANAVLSALTGSTVSLSAVDYASLMSTNIDMGSYLRTLAPSVGLSAGTYSQVLNAKIALPTALAALDASGLDTSTQAAIAAVLRGLGTTGPTFSLNGLLDLGAYDNSAVTTVPPVTLTMTAFEVLSGAVALASGNHQATVDLGPAVPGITDAKVTLSIGQRPVSATIVTGDQSTTVSTMQVNVSLVISASVSGLASVQLPLVLQLSQGVAQTAGPTCSNGSPTLTLNVTPSATELWVGDGASLPLPAAEPTPGAGAVATILGVPISASANAAINSAGSTPEVFTLSDVTNGTVQTTSGVDPVAALLTTSLGGLTFSVGGSRLPNFLPSSSIASLTSGLQGLASPAATILDSVMESLGLRIGQADTWVTDLKCGTPSVTQ